MFSDSHETQVVNAIQKTLPAVIGIGATKTITEVQQEMKRLGVAPEQYRDRLMNESENGTLTISAGSAFVVDAPEGIALSNKHVFQDIHADYSAMVGDKKLSLTIKAIDPLADIAIVQIPELPASVNQVALGASRQVRLGQTVIAIGNALGEFSNTISTGIISGLSRYLSAITDLEGHHERLRGLIQTDAAINPGNSGGPLVNLNGEAIGINTAVVSGAQNISFAIPIDRAKRDLDQVRSHGHIRTPFLGVRYLLLNKKIQERFHTATDHGALIINEELPGDQAVIPGSAAERAGLREGDIILAVNEKVISAHTTLEDMMDEFLVGDTVVLRVLRNHKELFVHLTLEDRMQQR